MLAGLGLVVVVVVVVVVLVVGQRYTSDGGTHHHIDDEIRKLEHQRKSTHTHTVRPPARACVHACWRELVERYLYFGTPTGRKLRYSNA